MGSDLTGLLGIVIVAGLAYVVLSNPDILKGKDANGSDPGNVTGTSGDGTSTGSTSCKSLCAAADCDGYDDEGCTAGCSACKKAGRVGGGSGSSGGSSGKGCNGDASSCPSCGAYPKYRVCKSNNTCGCDTFGGSSGGSSGGSTPKCVVTKCPSCGSLPNYRICKNNKCGCDKSVCKYSNSSQCPSCKPGQAKKLSNCKCSCTGTPSPTGGSGGNTCSCKQGSKCSGLTGAACCAWRGSNGGCSSGFKGVSHPGGGCDCVRKSNYARAYYARPNIRTSYRFSGM